MWETAALMGSLLLAVLAGGGTLIAGAVVVWVVSCIAKETLRVWGRMPAPQLGESDMKALVRIVRDHDNNREWER